MMVGAGVVVGCREVINSVSPLPTHPAVWWAGISIVSWVGGMMKSREGKGVVENSPWKISSS